jgi:hypothetical protein
MLWLPRATPLKPTTVLACGAAVAGLLARLRSLSDEDLTSLRGVSGKALLIVLGPEDALPWADGVVYLGRDPSAPSLLLPTNIQPSAPLDLFERALRRQFPTLTPPIIALPELVASVAEARPISRVLLTSRELLEALR